MRQQMHLNLIELELRFNVTFHGKDKRDGESKSGTERWDCE